MSCSQTNCKQTNICIFIKFNLTKKLASNKPLLPFICMSKARF